MTIGIDARMYGAEQTGIGAYIEHLIKYSLKKDRKNFYKIFLMPSEFDKFLVYGKNVKKIKVNSRWYGWREQVILPWQMLKENVDLMHFPHFNIPVLYKKKFVVTIHDLTPLYFPGRKMGGSWHRRKAFRFVFQNAVRRANKVIAVSNYTRDDLVKNFSVNRKKIEVIHEGVKRMENYDLIDIKKYGVCKPYIFYTGVWREHKNLVNLIKAFDVLVNEYKLDIQLVLGGKEDPFYPEIRKTWESLNLGDRIVAPGFLTEEELWNFYRRSSLFVIPSFAEGFGFVGLEAMSQGVPVASSNVTSLPEVCGDAAVYFDPYDVDGMAEKMGSVLNDNAARKNLIHKGKENIKRFCWNKMAKETLELYNQIL